MDSVSKNASDDHFNHKIQLTLLLLRFYFPKDVKLLPNVEWQKRIQCKLNTERFRVWPNNWMIVKRSINQWVCLS